LRLIFAIAVTSTAFGAHAQSGATYPATARVFGCELHLAFTNVAAAFADLPALPTRPVRVMRFGGGWIAGDVPASMDEISFGGSSAHPTVTFAIDGAPPDERPWSHLLGEGAIEVIEKDTGGGPVITVRGDSTSSLKMVILHFDSSLRLTGFMFVPRPGGFMQYRVIEDDVTQDDVIEDDPH